MHPGIGGRRVASLLGGRPATKAHPDAGSIVGSSPPVAVVATPVGSPRPAGAPGGSSPAVIVANRIRIRPAIRQQEMIVPLEQGQFGRPVKKIVFHAIPRRE